MSSTDKTGRQQVIDVLHERRGGRRGPERLVLCIEGGGLRGVVSAGMVTALHDLGFAADQFDAIYGASAGGLAGAYFIDGAVDEAMPLYYRDVPTFFLDWSRLVRRRPLLALDRLIDETITVDRPLDVEKVIASGQLRLIASDIGETAGLGSRRPQPIRAECFPPPASPGELQSFLRATTRIPLLGGPPVSVEDPPSRPAGRRTRAHAYLDAFVTEGLPLETPIAEGATHVVVLATKPYRAPDDDDRLVTRLVRRRLARLNPNLPGKLRGIGDRSRRLAALIDRGQTTPGPGEPAIWCVSPAGDMGVPRLRPDAGRILAAAVAGYRLMRDELGADQPVTFETDPRFRAVYR